MEVNPDLFRAYDIRGLTPKPLNESTARLIGRAIGTMVRESGGREVFVARDGRLSSMGMAIALFDGINAAGADVIDLGLAPTSLLYYATATAPAGSGVMITASHNPADHNGFKVVVSGKALHGEQIQDILRSIQHEDFATGSGRVKGLDIAPRYLQDLQSRFPGIRSLKVVVDCGNAVPGLIAPAVLETIGCKVIPIHCELDGTFPNHHPDPAVPENLHDLSAKVIAEGSDLGVAFDGDGDRLGVVDETGTPVNPDRVLMLFIEQMLTNNPGATVVYDVKCSAHVATQIEKLGGRADMWKTGHSLIKSRMVQEGALLGAEMTGHYCHADRWYGFDDALYAAARLVEIIGSKDAPASEVFAQFHTGIATPEIRIPLPEGAASDIVTAVSEEKYWPGARFCMLDGFRADLGDGFALVRASNTSPALMFRFEADTEEAMLSIQRRMRKAIAAVAPDITLPF